MIKELFDNGFSEEAKVIFKEDPKKLKEDLAEVIEELKIIKDPVRLEALIDETDNLRLVQVIDSEGQAYDEVTLRVDSAYIIAEDLWFANSMFKVNYSEILRQNLEDYQTMIKEFSK